MFDPPVTSLSRERGGVRFCCHKSSKPDENHTIFNTLQNWPVIANHRKSQNIPIVNNDYILAGFWFTYGIFIVNNPMCSPAGVLTFRSAILKMPQICKLFIRFFLYRCRSGVLSIQHSHKKLTGVSENCNQFIHDVKKMDYFAYSLCASR